MNIQDCYELEVMVVGNILNDRKHLSEMADTRQDQLVRTLDGLRIANQFILCADRAQRVLHRLQVAGAVIEYRDHSKPFVEGNCSFNRASVEHA
mgnify:CR=1 FL=1